MSAVVLDTNVFVAAGFNPASASANLVRAVRDGRLRMPWTDATRREIEHILGRIPPLRSLAVAELFHPADHVTAPIPYDWFDDIPASAALYLDPDGTPRDVGTLFRNPELAATYGRIADRGPKAFYKGDVAEALVDTVRNPVVSPTANHVWRSGVMTLRDLDKYKAPLRPPTHITYRGLDVYGMGPPSSGGSSPRPGTSSTTSSSSSTTRSRSSAADTSRRPRSRPTTRPSGSWTIRAPPR